MKKVIISLVGYGGSGKSSAAQYLKQTYGFAVFTFSSVIREYAAAHNLSLRNRPDYARTHAEIVEKFGLEFMPATALKLTSELICVDDLSSRLYARKLRAAGGVEIAFVCPVETRFAHVSGHSDSAKYPDTLEAFIQNEQDDEKIIIAPGLRLESKLVARDAHYHIDAAGSLENTFRQLDEIVKPLLARQDRTVT